MFLADIAVGAAIYDNDMRLVSANSAFYETRRISPNHCPIGTSMREVIRQSHGGPATSSTPAFDQFFQTCVRKLRETGRYTLVTDYNGSEKYRCNRYLKSDGTIFETVEALHNPSRNEPDIEAAFETAQAENRRILEAIDNMRDGFAIFDEDGILVAVNERYRELSPHVADVIKVGATHREIIEAVADSGFSDLTGKSREEFIAFATKERLTPSAPTVDRMANGTWVRFAGQRLADGSTVFVQSDVTELRKHQLENERMLEEVQNKTSQLNLALDSMIQGFILYDEDDNVVVSNKRYKELHDFSDDMLKPGTSRLALLDDALERGLFTDQEAHTIRERVAQTLEDRTTCVSKRRFRDGTVVSENFRDMGRNGSIVTFHDITKSEKIKAELKNKNVKLARSNDELQNFAYVASHDLQEPLRKIEAFSDRLFAKCNDNLDDDGRLYLDRIQNAAGRMRQLINDLLSFSRVTSQSKPFEPTNLQEVLDGVISDVQVRLEESGGRVESTGLTTIDADNLQMRQLFQNLISNSLKFVRPDEPPVIHIDANLIRQRSKHGSDTPMLRIAFQDNGIGFENRFKDQIFAIFQRLHGRMEYEGTGIGLSTCRKIVERHNGTIDADGKPGIGATFTVDLPTKQLMKGDEFND